MAFRIPNLLRDLFAEGALSSAFVPTFTDADEKSSQKEAFDFANLVIGSLLLIVGLITLLGMVFSSPLVSMIGPGFSEIEGKHELTVTLTRIMFPFLPLVALSSIFMGMLNVKRRFGLPAMAPVVFNLISIVIGGSLFFWEMDPYRAVLIWSIGTILAGFFQTFMQLPALYRLGFRFRPTLRNFFTNPRLRQIGILGIPAIIGLAGSRINIVVNTILASLIDEGSPSWLNYAFRLIHLPIGVFGVALSVVTLSVVSRNVAQNKESGFAKNLERSITLILLLSLPSAIGLWILRVPIIRVIFEHGVFSSQDTHQTALALACFAVGLPAYALIKILTPAFYAKGNARPPMIASLVGVAANIAFNFAVYRSWGHWGLALGTSLSAFLNLALLFWWLDVENKRDSVLRIFHMSVKVVLASIPMIFVALYVSDFWEKRATLLHFQLLQVLTAILTAVATYFITLHFLGVREAKQIVLAFRKRFGF